MNLLDEIHQHLATNGPSKPDAVTEALIDPKLINPNKVVEDLNRLMRMGRVTCTNGVWEAVPA